MRDSHHDQRALLGFAPTSTLDFVGQTSQRRVPLPVQDTRIHVFPPQPQFCPHAPQLLTGQLAAEDSDDPAGRSCHETPNIWRAADAAALSSHKADGYPRLPPTTGDTQRAPLRCIAPMMCHA